MDDTRGKKRVGNIGFFFSGRNVPSGDTNPKNNMWDNRYRVSFAMNRGDGVQSGLVATSSRIMKSQKSLFKRLSEL